MFRNSFVLLLVDSKKLRATTDKTGGELDHAISSALIDSKSYPIKSIGDNFFPQILTRSENPIVFNFLHPVWLTIVLFPVVLF